MTLLVAVKPRHHLQTELKAVFEDQPRGLSDALGGMAAAVFEQDGIVHTLRTELDRGNAVFLEKRKYLAVYKIRSRRDPDARKVSRFNEGPRGEQKLTGVFTIYRRKASSEKGYLAFGRASRADGRFAGPHNVVGGGG